VLLDVLDGLPALDVLLDVLDELPALDVLLAEPPAPAVPPAPVVPLPSRTTLPPQAATAVSARTREIGTGRAGMAAAYRREPVPAMPATPSRPWSFSRAHPCSGSPA
jgi:hypothetical protein